MTNTDTTPHNKIYDKHTKLYEKNTNKVILYETFVTNETRSVHVIPLSEITYIVMKQQTLTIGFKTHTLSFPGT
jgi:hypothetical protein